MSSLAENPAIWSDSSKIQFVHESPLLIEVSGQESKASRNDVSSDEECWFDDSSSAKKLKPGKKTRGRVKIKMEFINNKAYELVQLTGAELMLLVASETGHVYTFATEKLKPIIDREEGQDLIEACLNNDKQAKHTHASETSAKLTSFKKSTLGRPVTPPPAPVQEVLTTTMINSNVVKMVVNEIQPESSKKIVVPIDLSQHLHYHIQNAQCTINTTSTDNNTTNNKPTSSNKSNKTASQNRTSLKMKGAKHKVRNAPLNKAHNSAKLKGIHATNNPSTHVKSFKHITSVKNDDTNNKNDVFQALKVMQNEVNKNNTTYNVITSHRSILPNNNNNNYIINVSHLQNNNIINLNNNHNNIINNINLSLTREQLGFEPAHNHNACQQQQQQLL